MNRIHPDFSISRPKYNSDQHFMWLNTKGYTLPHGMGVGGNTANFRMFIPESLETCTGGSACTTFDVGGLSSTKEFELIALEVREENVITEGALKCMSVLM